MPDSTLISTGVSIEALQRDLPGYVVVREVGHGAMGIVFEALQSGLGRRVAVKVLPPNLALRERTVRRFVREAEAMGRLGHPGIVDVFEVGSRRELHFFSMKFVEGPPLDRVLRAGPLAIEDVVSIGVGVADALAHAHSRGVLHRDVKPANLLRDGQRVVLTDFGLARPIDSADAGSMTESGDLVGTPLYMAPEQISGDAQRVDGRADIWGLGVTLYELLCGRTPFLGPNAQGILHAILHRDPALVRKLRDDVPRDLEAVVLKCLEKDPAQRYMTAAALREDLEAVREGRAVSASRPRFFDPALRWVRRHPAEAAVMGVILSIALFLGLYWRSASRELKSVSQERDEANALRTQAIAQSQEAQSQRRLTWAFFELSEVRQLRDSARTEDERLEAEGRILDLLELMPPEQDIELAETSLTLLAKWIHERGVRDEDVLARLDSLLDGRDLKLQLLLRAAVMTGMARYEDALALHRERAQLDREDPAPFLGAARTLRIMSQVSREASRERLARQRTASALGMLGQAAALAIAARNEAILIDILIERARCFLDLGQDSAALIELDRALAKDPGRVEAVSLKMTAERHLRNLDAALAPPVSAALPEPVEEESTPVVLPTLLPSGEDLTQNLQSAGRGLKSIYRGLHQLLNAGATEPRGEPASSKAAPDAAPPRDP